MNADFNEGQENSGGWSLEAIDREIAFVKDEQAKEVILELRSALSDAMGIADRLIERESDRNKLTSRNRKRLNNFRRDALKAWKLMVKTFPAMDDGE